MISCTDFIPAYSELFKYLEKKGGPPAVEDFWNYLSDQFLNNLRELMIKHGIRGYWIYCSRTLNEEAADFTMEMDEAAGELTVTIHQCPSKGRLLREKHIEPYHDYCRHCDVLYRRVVEPLGYECILDMSQCHRAECREIIRKK